MPHQIKAVKEMTNGCVLTGGVGTGKTITSLLYWYVRVCKGLPQMPGVERKAMKEPKDIYVFTTARKRDTFEWEEDALKFGVARDANSDGVKIHIDSWQNIYKYYNLENAFVVFDEQRLVGNGSWVKAFYKISAHNDWIMLSATPGDDWMDYIPLFVAHGYYKNRTEFLRKHAVWSRFAKFPKVERWVETSCLEQYRHSLLVDMPYERHTTRVVVDRSVDYDEDKFKDVVKRRWNPYTDEPIKDAAELFAVLRRITNEDLSRLGEILVLLERHPRLIVFYNYNYELDLLRSISNTTGIETAEWNGQKHEEVPEGDRWLYLVQYTAGAEAWNCIRTDAIAFWSLNYSYRIMEQAKGRIDRLNTPYEKLYYYLLKSNSPSDKGVSKALQTKKTFNEKKFAEALWNASNEQWTKSTPMEISEMKDIATTSAPILDITGRIGTILNGGVTVDQAA